MARSSPAPSGRALLNLSGGVDSAYAAWRWLSERRGRLLIHHCHLRNREGRLDVEAAAYRATLAWLRENGFDDFEVVETGFDYGTVPHIVWDIEIIGFLTGLVLRGNGYKDITKVIMTATADDLRIRNIQRRQRRRDQLAQLMLPTKKIEPVWISRHLTKKQMMQAMPAELLALTWSCRRPREGRPCGECYTCKLTTRAGLHSRPAS